MAASGLTCSVPEQKGTPSVGSAPLQLAQLDGVLGMGRAQPLEALRGAVLAALAVREEQALGGRSRSTALTRPPARRSGSRAATREARRMPAVVMPLMEEAALAGAGRGGVNLASGTPMHTNSPQLQTLAKGTLS